MSLIYLVLDYIEDKLSSIDLHLVEHWILDNDNRDVFHIVLKVYSMFKGNRELTLLWFNPSLGPREAFEKNLKIDRQL